MFWAGAYFARYFVFLILGKEAWIVFSEWSKRDKKWKVDLVSLQLEAIRYSQWALVWFGGLVELSGDKFIF